MNRFESLGLLSIGLFSMVFVVSCDAPHGVPQAQAQAGPSPTASAAPGASVPAPNSVGGADEKADGEKTDAGKNSTAKKPNPARGGILGADAKTTGKIKGVVLFQGKPPQLPPLKVKKEHKDVNYCGHEIPDEAIIVSDKNQIANAVVSLVKVPAYKAKKREVTIDNAKCIFVPHVVATTKGSTLLVTSSDDGIYHSAQGLLANEFNVAITSSKTVIKQPRLRPGWTLIKCTGHEWMAAQLLVFEHDFFAITGKDGRFSIEGIPPGDYEIAVWHERLALDIEIDKPTASRKQKVTVKAGGEAEVKFELKQP